MDKSFISTLLKVTGVAVVFLLLNMGLYLIPGVGDAAGSFVYPVYLSYLFFYVFSIIILFALHLIASKNAAQAGYVFLLLTTLKVVAAYLYMRPILSKTIESSTEKINVFVIFMLFLSVEAYFTAQLLNKKQ